MSASVSTSIRIRAVRPSDFDAWLPLWDGYNAFYGRSGETALPLNVTRTTWARFLDDEDSIFALVAERDGVVVGLVHYLYHRSTTRLEGVCYLQDLFTREDQRGAGIGRALIEGVYSAARRVRIRKVYWQTHESNAAGRRLYDQVSKHDGFIVYATELECVS